MDEDYFRKRVRAERERRGWTQPHMAELLTGGGTHMHATTIAKIEAGDRSVRIDEAAAIADLFEVSLDSLRGAKAKLENEHVHTLRAVFDTAQQCGWQLAAIRTTLGDRFRDLETLDFEGRESLESDAAAAWKALGDASEALGRISLLRLPAEAVVRLRDSVVERAAD